MPLSLVLFIMSEKDSNNKRIAKNTMFLYIRMFISLVVSLYTSRVVINVLGVEDYGIYGVVGGVVGMLGFLNSSMTGATSRFISYELGRGDKTRIVDTFSNALLSHGLIALFVLVVSETVGLWFINNKLVIPEERFVAAQWLYQFSILSAIITIFQVPYNSAIVAHEKMGVYAYVEILNVTLKLFIVFALQWFGIDKLILYSALLVGVTLLLFLIYIGYCFKHFEETRFHLSYNKSIINPMLSYSGWNLYSNFAVVARQQGVNILINMFFGPLLNAASSIATTVSTIILQFATNVVIAIKPQIIKNYAQKKYDEMVRLIDIGSVINFILLSLLSIPLLCEMHYVLQLWLGVVPEYAVPFCQLSLIYNIIYNQYNVIIQGMIAIGRVRKTSIINGTLYILVLPITYICFKCGTLNPMIPYAINIVAMLFSMSSVAHILSSNISEYSYWQAMNQFIFKYTLPFIFVSGIAYYSSTFIEESFLRLVLTTLVSTVLLFSISLIWIMTDDMRHFLLIKYNIKMIRKGDSI